MSAPSAATHSLRCASEVPQLLGAAAGEGALLADRAAQGDDVLGGVVAADAVPARVGVPLALRARRRSGVWSPGRSGSCGGRRWPAGGVCSRCLLRCRMRLGRTAVGTHPAVAASPSRIRSRRTAVLLLPEQYRVSSVSHDHRGSSAVRSPTRLAPPLATPKGMLDALTLGRRIRHLRTARGLTLDASRAADRPRAVAGLDDRERQARAAGCRCCSSIAAALGYRVDDCSRAEPPSQRAALEIALERAQRGPLFAALGLPRVPRRQGHSRRDARDDPRPARRARAAAPGARGHPGGGPPGERASCGRRCARATTTSPSSRRRRASCSPPSGTPAGRSRSAWSPTWPRTSASRCTTSATCRTRPARSPTSATAASTCRTEQSASRDSRSPLLQALASHVLGHDGAERLRATSCASASRRTTSTAASWCRRRDAVRVPAARRRRARRISIEDLRDAFAVSYETAAHRFTNLATRHLGHPGALHEGARVGHDHQGVRERRRAVPDRRPRRGRGAARVPQVDARGRCSTSRTGSAPGTSTPTRPTGTYWCTSRIEKAKEGEFSVSVGVPFAHVKWFRGRETPHRAVSALPGRVVLPPRARRRSPSGGTGRPGRRRARRRACSPRCPPAPSPGSTRPRSTSSSRRTPPRRGLR